MSKLKASVLIKSPYFNSIGNKLSYCILTFVANALFTRTLGLELKGVYTWHINFASMLSIILGLGVYHSMPYYMRKEKNRDWNREYINIFYAQMLFYLFVLVILLVFCQDKEKVMIVGVLSIADALTQQLSMLLLIDKLYVKNRIFLIGSFVNLILAMVCYFFARGNLQLTLGCYLGIRLLYIVLYTKGVGILPHPTKVSIKSIVEKIKFGYLPMFSFLLITANYKIDVLMLEGSPVVSPEQLSLYSTGVSMAEIGWLIPDVFKEVLFSRIAQKKNDAEVSSALRVSNVIILIVILGIIIFGRAVIYILFGSEFVPAYKVTILLFLGIPTMSWFKMIYQLFNAEGKRKTSFFVLFTSTIVNIVMNCILIPYYGIYGAAIASIASYNVCGFIFLILYARSIRVNVFTLFIPKISDLKVLFKFK